MPVMLFNVILNGVKYSKQDYIALVLITIGTRGVSTVGERLCFCSTTGSVCDCVARAFVVVVLVCAAWSGVFVSRGGWCVCVSGQALLCSRSSRGMR